MPITAQIRANGSIDEDYATLTTGQIRAYKSSMKTSRLPTVYATLADGQIRAYGSIKGGGQLPYRLHLR